ncbi:hypothetical protein [Pseudomonas taiwanensis]|uniref:hypothetical protein n=1 Tax=Pseudomonas taiwanensis TaxID=470150 RepID=UPI0015C10135|nr:hypothetical protein [Pseudomonas taiwanensis]
MAKTLIVSKSMTPVGNGRTLGTYRTAGGVTVQNYQDNSVTTQVELSYAEYADFRTKFAEKFGVKLPNYLEPELGKGAVGATNPNGNTVGRVVGEVVAAKGGAGGSNPPVAVEGVLGDKLLDGLQTGLDVVGLIPGVGEFADLANAGVSLARGDYAGAALSLASAIPFAGWLGTAGKVGRRGAKAAAEGTANTTKEGEKLAAVPKSKSGGKGRGKRKKDPCKPLQNGVPGNNYRGGRHGNIKKGGYSYQPRRESHHMPADAAYTKVNGKSVSSESKPSIQMDKGDHERSASWGSSSEADKYRKQQEKLMKGGKAGYYAALMMDITDVRSKFGDKYDEAIAQMLAWAKGVYLMTDKGVWLAEMATILNSPRNKGSAKAFHDLVYDAPLGEGSDVVEALMRSFLTPFDSSVMQACITVLSGVSFSDYIDAYLKIFPTLIRQDPDSALSLLDYPGYEMSESQISKIKNRIREIDPSGALKKELDYQISSFNLKDDYPFSSIYYQD